MSTGATTHGPPVKRRLIPGSCVVPLLPRSCCYCRTSVLFAPHRPSPRKRPRCKLPAGSPTTRVAKPRSLVPEFRPIALPGLSPPLSRALSTPRKGYVASAEGSQEDKTDITVGIHWSPEEFISEALKIGHPEQVTNLLPPELRALLDKNETTSLHAIGMERRGELRRWISLVNRHAGDEAQLKTTLGERRAEVLKDKRILLLRQLIADSGHSDLSLPDDLARGFDLTGKLPPSSFFADKFHPASLPCASLRGVADRARDILISSAKSSGDHDMDVALYEATLKERDKGFLVGPVDPSALRAGSTITRRFGVQ